LILKRTDEGGLSSLPGYRKEFNYIVSLRGYERIPSATS